MEVEEAKKASESHFFSSSQSSATTPLRLFLFLFEALRSSDSFFLSTGGLSRGLPLARHEQRQRRKHSHKTTMAEASSYLRSFVESTAELPAEVQRTVLLMRELDDKSAALQESADAAARALLLGEPVPAAHSSGAASLAALAASTGGIGGGTGTAKRTKPSEASVAEMRERMEADMKQVRGGGEVEEREREREKRDEEMIAAIVASSLPTLFLLLLLQKKT